MVSIVEKDIEKYFKNIFNKNFFIAVILFLLYFIQSYKLAFPDAWVQKKHRGIFISSYEMRSFIGTNSLLQYDRNIQYTQGMLSLYGEYGVTNRVTINAKIIAIDSMLVDRDFFLGKVKNRSIGLDTAQFTTRIGIIRNNKIITLSIIAGIGMPSFYHQNQASQFAIRKYKQITGIEIGIKINKRDFFAFTTHVHWNIQHWYNEFRLEVVYGHYFLQNLLFMVRFQEFIYYIHNQTERQKSYQDKNNQLFNFIANSNFAKFTISFTVPVLQNLMLELGAYTSVKSKLLKTKNLGLKMRGFFISLWYNF